MKDIFLFRWHKQNPQRFPPFTSIFQLLYPNPNTIPHAAILSPISLSQDYTLLPTLIPQNTTPLHDNSILYK